MIKTRLLIKFITRCKIYISESAMVKIINATKKSYSIIVKTYGAIENLIAAKIFTLAEIKKFRCIN